MPVDVKGRAAATSANAQPRSVWDDLKTSGIPFELVDPLEASYRELKENYFLGRHRPGELEGGHFAEAALRVMQWATGGIPSGQPFTPVGAQLPRFDQEVRRLEGTPATFLKSVRIHIPRVLLTMQDVRNGRGVGHLSGDVNPNAADAALLVACADWVLAELVRVYHGRPLDEAQAIVNAIVQRRLPDVQAFGEQLKVLRDDFTHSERILAILYNRGESGALTVDIARDVRLPANETRRLLRALDRIASVHLEETEDRAFITRVGMSKIEERLLSPSSGASRLPRRAVRGLRSARPRRDVSRPHPSH